MLFYFETTNTQSGKKIGSNFAIWQVKFDGFPKKIRENYITGKIVAG